MRRLLPIALLLAVAAPAGAQRLPGDVVPEHYTLWFDPHLADATFDGRATIEARVTAPTRSITLHAADLRLGRVQVTSGGRTQEAVVTLDAKAETATLQVAEPLGEGAVSIAITYSGTLNDKLRGFYRSAANGRSYAVTQMEPTDARRAFPSFDEPRYKATFDMSVTVDAGDVAISNGRQTADAAGPRPGTRTLSFARTPKMSTYLVAMLVGDFVCRTGASDGIPIRVCSTPDKQDQTAFALEAAKHQIAFFNDYFGVRYPFGKLDIIGIPDFAAGAMENAGAITFRERVLLVDERTAPADQRKTVASVIAHELAHQWFGNLVTMTWWDDIWLNEGFATWAANKPLAAWRPEWAMDVSVARELQEALAIDELSTTRAIRIHVDTPDEINQVFDPIAYEKTASVLAMIERYVGASTFRRGISAYLKRFAFANATGEDFWNEMRRVTGAPVDRILRSFVDQEGAPLLTVATACGKRSVLTLTQERFSAAAGSSQSEQGRPPLWVFPACMQEGSGRGRCHLIDTSSRTVALDACRVPFVNRGSAGYYVTAYPPAAIEAFASSAGRLSPAERLSLLGDEWRMVTSGRHDVGTYLDLAGSWADEVTPAVMEQIAGRVRAVARTLVAPADRAAYDAWVRGRFAPALAALGPPDPKENDNRQALRASLLGLLASAGDATVLAESARLARLYLENRDAVAPDLVRQTLTSAAIGGDSSLYDSYVAALGKASAQPEEYNSLLAALVAFGSPALVTRTLQYALSPAVRSQDSPTLIAGLLGTPSGRDLAWRFVQDEWDALVEKLGVFQGIPPIVGALGGFCSIERARDIRAFFATRPVPAAARSLQQALERVERCAAVAERQSAPLAAWLATRRGAR